MSRSYAARSVKFCAFGILWTLVNVAVAAPGLQILDDIRRDVRDDGFEEKIRLLEQAFQNGDYVLALALSESIKDTAAFQIQLGGEMVEPDLSSSDCANVSALPASWRRWADGWTYVKALTLTETAGLPREAEPVDIVVDVPASDAVDLGREMRVARIEPNGGLVETPSQVYDETRRDAFRQCHVVFFADVPANAAATYLIFYGNPFAERPKYPTDLEVAGDGYALEVSNRHFTAKLSDQNGQMERIRFKREHGLELYAGGKGHGEPPTIDWSNDYVDQDHYQKLRIRNWSRSPNYTVVNGPLCVRVRRWGFPHSPIYPLFTPSRMLIDQTYVFYAGKDYFIKEGTMSAAKDFDFTTMRDDEWVLSGYSFTDSLWLDRDGALREGPVPPDQADSIWGTGFYNRDGRDMFLALWLEHSSNRSDKMLRNGVPIMHYYQHGQLWSRYPLGGSESLTMKQGDTLYQRNAYLIGAYPKEKPAEVIGELRTRLMNPLQIAPAEVPKIRKPSVTGALARQGETSDSAGLKPALWAALRDVRDEQLYRVDGNVVDMGYVYDVSVEDGVVRVLVSMPHRGRGVYQYITFHGGGRETEGIRERLMRVEGVRDVLVDFTWEPAWTAARLTDAGRRSMGFDH